MRWSLSVLLCCSTYALVPENRKDTMMNFRSNFEKTTKYCNVYDEANFCQQIVVDHRISLVAVSYKCECPDGWTCPSDPSETAAYTECQYVESKYWRKCQMKCTPDDQSDTDESEELQDP